MMRPLVIAIGIILGLAILLAVVLANRIDDTDYDRVETTSEPTPTTTWLETQPTLGDGFDELLAGVARAKAAHRPKRVPVAHTSRGEWPWDAVKECETPGLGWDANTGNGFEGGLQFEPRTWSSYRRGDYPPRAYMATREQQIVVANAVLAAQGWGAWPTCSSKLGLR